MIQAALVGLVVLLGAGRAAAAFVTVSFDSPTYVGDTATVGVNLRFDSSNPADRLEAFQLSVVGSDPALTANNFSRFSFTADPLLTGWAGTPSDFGAGYVFFSTLTNGLAPAATSYRVGTITVDLSGLDPASPLTVTLNGLDPLFPTSAAGTVGGTFDFITVDASGATVQLQPTAVIPEPASLVLFGLGGMALICRRRSGLRPSTSAA